MRLFSRGADVNQATASGNTPLMLAARLGSLPLIQALLQAGAKIDERNNFGNTALMIAASEGRADAARALVAAGADKSLRNKKREKAADVAGAAGHADIAMRSADNFRLPLGEGGAMNAVFAAARCGRSGSRRA